MKFDWINKKNGDLIDEKDINYLADSIKTLNNEKVNKVEGMGLSTNDFTDLEKAKLAGFRDADYYASDDDIIKKQDKDFIVYVYAETHPDFSDTYEVWQSSADFTEIESAYGDGKNIYVRLYIEKRDEISLMDRVSYCVLSLHKYNWNNSGECTFQFRGFSGRSTLVELALRRTVHGGNFHFSWSCYYRALLEEGYVGDVLNLDYPDLKTEDKSVLGAINELNTSKQNKDFIVTAEETFNENGYRILSDLSETFVNIKSAYDNGKNVYLKVYSKDTHLHYFIAPLTSIDDGVAGFKTIRDIRGVACIWSVNVISQQYDKDILMLGMQDLCSKYELDTKQNKATVLGEMVVDTPLWENQPTVDGEVLVGMFDTSDFYYVTLKDASGNALPGGQFMLKHFYSDATPIACVFYLNGLNTGADTGVLTENTPVEFVAVDDNWLLRHAGVAMATIPLNQKFSDLHKITIETSGQFCPMTTIGYFAPHFSLNQNVLYSEKNKVWGTDDYRKEIRNYASFSAEANFKTIKFHDELTITNGIDNHFSTERKVLVAKRKYDDSMENKFATYSDIVLGMGEVIEPLDTMLTSAVFTALKNSGQGVIRNGTVIRVTEVR